METSPPPLLERRRAAKQHAGRQTGAWYTHPGVRTVSTCVLTTGVQERIRPLCTGFSVLRLSRRSASKKGVGQQAPPPNSTPQCDERHGFWSGDQDKRGKGMATIDTGQSGAWEVSRRDFLKTTAAAAAAAGCGLGFAFDAEKAAAYEGQRCEATRSPARRARTARRAAGSARSSRTARGKVIDMYGDFESPFNSGGLCAKGAGTLPARHQPAPHRRVERRAPRERGLPGEDRRVELQRPIRFRRTGRVLRYSPADYSYDDGVAWFREANNAWQRVPLAVAMEESAKQLYTARGGTALTPGAQPQGRRVPRLVAHEQRVELPVPQAHRELRYGEHRASGPYMTLVHGVPVWHPHSDEAR